MHSSLMDPPIRCSDCHMGFAPADADDSLRHEVFHRRYEALAGMLGRRPVGYQEREKMKVDGDRLVREGKDVSERIAGATQVLLARFDREVLEQIAEELPAIAPVFRDYVANENLESLFGREVGAAVRRYWAAPLQ